MEKGGFVKKKICTRCKVSQVRYTFYKQTVKSKRKIAMCDSCWTSLATLCLFYGFLEFKDGYNFSKRHSERIKSKE